MAEMHPGLRPGEYLMTVPKKLFEDLQREVAAGNRLPNETMAQYVKRNPRLRVKAAA